MAADIERLIESLIDDISCHGDLGCSVSHVLETADKLYHPAGQLQSEHRQDVQFDSSRQTLWDWLRSREDVFVGKDRKWNHLGLSEIVAMPEEPAAVAAPEPSTDQVHPGDAPSEGDRPSAPSQLKLMTKTAAIQYRPKVYVSEDQMWQSLAGHGADFKRVPRMEWAALVGIASTKKEGIIQGDLCRLIGQDKRSLPRRTDALAQKGYIVKRTTLIRGVKTSKMWLRRHAPSLSASPTAMDSGKSTQNGASNVNLSPENLNKDIEPVPWRSRWTGKAIDMQSLAETVIAIVKAFGIIRYHDLRKKLGILALPWQMKTTARFCRWMVRRGIIHYVGATLGDRLYKDCVKFIRDFTSDDWADWLKTGKEKARPKTDANLDAYRDNPTGSASESRTKKSERGIDIMIAWKPEKPLPTTVIDAIRAGSAKGVSNRYIGAHTMGPPFSRYITSVSTTLATPSLQPKHLAHFQVSKELQRVKKQSIYFFSVPRMRDSRSKQPNGTVAHNTSTELPGDEASPSKVSIESQALDQYFSPIVLDEMSSEPVDLTKLSRMIESRTRLPTNKQPQRLAEGSELAGSVKPFKKRKATPEGSQTPGIEPEDHPDLVTAQVPRVFRQSAGGRGTHGTRGKKNSTFILTFRVSAAKLAAVLQKSGSSSPAEQGLEQPPQVVRNDLAQNHDPAREMEESTVPETQTTLEHGQVEREAASPTDQPGSLTGQPDEGNLLAAATEATMSDSVPTATSKKGRPKGSAKKQRFGSKAGGYRCEKCGRVWRNDNGLKYHLEKSSSACNSSYVPPPPKPTGFPAKRKSLPVEEPVSETDVAEVGRARRTRRAPARPVAAESPARTTPKTNRQSLDVSAAFQHAQPLRARPMYRRHVATPVASNIASYDSTTQTASQLTLHHATDSQVSSGPVEACRLIDSPLVILKDAGTRRINSEVLDRHTPRKQSRSGTVIDLGLGVSHGDFYGTTSEEPPRADRPPLNALNGLIRKGPVKEERYLQGEADEPQAQGFATPVLASGARSPEVEPQMVEGTATLPRAAPLGSRIPAFKMPTEMDRPSPFGQRHHSQLHRSSEIVRYLMYHHGGCFPGERTLWYALTAVWENSFPSESGPNFGTTQTVIRKMEEKKLLKKATHAFRDNKGAFKSVTVLLSPDTNPTSSAVLAWKDKMIAKHPETLVVSEFAPKSGLPDDTTWNGKPVFSTRRKLGQSVEVLDAPVYAVAPVRKRRGSGRPSQSPRKRQKFRADGTASSSHVPPEGEGPYEPRVFRLIAGGVGSDPSIISRPPERHSAPVSLTFLEPNSRLGAEDVDEQNGPQSSAQPQRRPRGRPPLKKQAVSAALGKSGEISTGRSGSVFMESLSLEEARGGSWPRLSFDFFEKHASFAMKGWLPSTQQTLFHCLPRDLADIMGPAWLRSQETMPETTYEDFELQVKKCQSWELDMKRRIQLLRMHSVAPDYIWVNHVVNIPVLEGVPDVCGWVAEDESTWSGEMIKSAIAMAPPKKRQIAADTESSSRRTIDPRLLPVDFKTRKMTPWTGPAKNGRPLSGSRQLDSSNNDALIAAFVATRTLLGGADKYVEWGLLMRLFPDKSLAWLRRFWSKTRKERAASINNLTRRFQKHFVKAYERNELPPIDFDDPLSYDWVRIIGWTLQLVGEAATLPPSRTELEREYVVKTGVADPNDWQRVYYNAQSSMFSRLEALTSKAICAPVDPKPPRRTIEDVGLHRATSWVRALCGTKPGRYDPALVRQRVSSVTPHGEEHNSALVGQAIAALQKKSIITKSKPRTGELGSHRFSDWFLPRLEKASQAQKYDEAVVFKTELDGIFRKNETYRIPYVLRDGEVMAMINMQVFGRIKVTPVDVPHIPLGFRPGFYESRKFPKSFYNFGLEVAPTEAYIYNEDMDFLLSAENCPPPRESTEGGLPLWSDIFGNPDERRWGQVIRAIAFAAAMRGPLNVDGIKLALNPCLDDFDVQLAIDWALRNKVLSMTTHGTSYTTDEWWWLVAGRQGRPAAPTSSEEGQGG